MEILTKGFYGYDVISLEGRWCGKVYDFYFDYPSWRLTDIAIRYRKGVRKYHTLVPINLVKEINSALKTVQLNLISARVKSGPVLKKDQVISRDFYSGHWTKYYAIPERSEANCFTASVGPFFDELKNEIAEETETGSRFYPLRRLKGFHLEANDGGTGKVTDTTINSKTYTVQSLVVRPSLLHWKKKRIINAKFIKTLDWEKKLTNVELTKEAAHWLRKFDPVEKSITGDSKIEVNYWGKLAIESHENILTPKVKPNDQDDRHHT